MSSSRLPAKIPRFRWPFYAEIAAPLFVTKMSVLADAGLQCGKAQTADVFANVAEWNSDRRSDMKYVFLCEAMKYDQG